MNHFAPAPSWRTELRTRVRTLAWLKALGNTVFLVVFFQLYLAIQKHPAFEVAQIPATDVDHWIGFQPWAIGLYLSLWVYTALPVALQPDKQRLVGYGVAMTVLCVLGLVVFYLWPSSVSEAVGPRPAGNALFAMLYAVDSNGNACPSLHVAASVMSCLWLHAILRKVAAPAWLYIVNLLWCAGIVFSTMATKQHLLLDVIAGALLGIAVGWLSVRRRGAV
ncbi:phosphatase PAP2 family protein [Ottowia sp. GY511]|uniref:Phosphatase PAP2 family protein n=1 Tax=Ottowia flava TaxID=2675430 RepID=A0ABW4KND9_9BURK|nr:phosphatase PAP2 family protein [Ottowia sp. GY511]TXK29528.1 phosphatase PAP2 family protein [Ottowia sp. GY511]